MRRFFSALNLASMCLRRMRHALPQSPLHVVHGRCRLVHLHAGLSERAKSDVLGNLVAMLKEHLALLHGADGASAHGWMAPGKK